MKSRFPYLPGILILALCAACPHSAQPASQPGSLLLAPANNHPAQAGGLTFDQASAQKRLHVFDMEETEEGSSLRKHLENSTALTGLLYTLSPGFDALSPGREAQPSIKITGHPLTILGVFRI